jgi:TonB-dependent SusC/RagA subfamily outer membrane receptor
MPADFELNTVNPDKIESISILKDKSANEIYGDEGKNGVIIIKTK